MPGGNNDFTNLRLYSRPLMTCIGDSLRGEKPYEDLAQADNCGENKNAPCSPF